MGADFISLFYNLQPAKFTYNHDSDPLFAPFACAIAFLSPKKVNSAPRF
jgi:hypothetical protein